MVHFVGAGSGAVDLITVRGMRYLENADVIIYAGSLVNPQLLEYAKEGCEIYNSAVMTLDEVVDVMKKADEQGKDIVRLHTGDHIRIFASARSFLHHQVRSMVGSLKRVGEGGWNPQDLRAALDAADRARCAGLAPPEGLYLEQVDY